MEIPGRDMKSIKRTFCATTLCVALGALLLFAGCGQSSESEQPDPASAPAAETPAVPESIPMGGAKSVMSFFITSKGSGKGGDLGGLNGADAHCQSLAAAEGAGDHTWRAYLSTTATPTEAAVNARDRISGGPWYNAEGRLIAADIAQLHGGGSRLNKETAFSEKFGAVNGVGDTPNTHDILTGSRADGSAFDGGEDLTCGNWTSSGKGRAQVGHHDRMGQGEGTNSWNSAHASTACGSKDLQSTGGAGLFYCFAID